MSTTSEAGHKYIVYQGYAERWRWRKVTADGATIRDADGAPVCSDIRDTEKFVTAEDAVLEVRSFDPDADIEVREAADFRHPLEQQADK